MSSFYINACLVVDTYKYVSSRMSNMLSIYRENDKVQRKARLITPFSR